MKTNKKILAAALLAGALIAVGTGANTASAAIDTSSTYTLSIPTVNTIVLKPSANFPTILPTDIGGGYTGTHAIILDDGTATTSYVASNSPTAGETSFEVTFAGNGTDDASLAGNVLTLRNAGNTASVKINITDHTKGATQPKLGGVTMTSGVNKFTATGITFTGGKAALDMALDLDESSLGIDDAAVPLAVDVVFRALNLNP